MNRFTLGYQKSSFGNVGDDLNPWLIRRLLPNVAFEESDKVLLCIGSIIVADRWERYTTKLVLGSGARSLGRIPVLDNSWDIRFVRGPRSAAALKVPSISDPALLISRYVSPTNIRKGIGIVPYYRSNRRIWQAAAAQVGARIISPRLDVESFIEAISSCERVFCEAMHGAIFADALRIPWRPISFQNSLFEGETHLFKWSDWAESVELTFDPLVQPLNRIADWSIDGKLAKIRAGVNGLLCSRDLASLMRGALKNDDRFALSTNDVFNDRVERMAAAFAKVNSGK